MSIMLPVQLTISCDESFLPDADNFISAMPIIQLKPSFKISGTGKSGKSRLWWDPNWPTFTTACQNINIDIKTRFGYTHGHES